MPDWAFSSLSLSPKRGFLLLAALLAAGSFLTGPAQAGEIKPSDSETAAAPSGRGTRASVPIPDTSMRAEARAALSKAVAFHRESKDLTLRFRASVYNATLDRQEEYNGRLLLKGKDKFRLEIPGGTFVSDGKTFWEYHPQNRQVILKDAADLEGKPLPGDMLLRFLDSEPLSLGKVRVEGKEYLEMRLDPSRAMKNLDSLAVLLDRKDYSVQRISSRDVSGNEAKYTVTLVRRNGGIKEKEFAFAVPPGAEAVDMRNQ